MTRHTLPASLRRGFTLVELMIVVTILGVLAAIVLPRLTDASQEARHNGISGQLQTIRRQMELYKAEHNDEIPDLLTNWDAMMDTTTVTNPPKTVGPYLQVIPSNPLNGRGNVVEGDGSASASTPCGFIYDYNSGAGSGKLFATDSDGTTVLPY